MSTSAKNEAAPTMQVPTLLPVKRLRKASVSATANAEMPSAIATKKRKSANSQLLTSGPVPTSRPLVKWKRSAKSLLSPEYLVPTESAPVKRNGKARAQMGSIIELPTHSATVSGDSERLHVCDTHNIAALLIPHIREVHRRRQDFHRAEKSLTLQIKAIGRRLAGQAINDSQAVAVSHPSSLNGGGDHSPGDNQMNSVSVPNFTGGEGQTMADTQAYNADAADLTGDEGHPIVDAQALNADISDLNGEQEEGHIESDDHSGNAELLLPATAPLIEARAVIKTRRLEVERECQKLAKQLPVWPWVEAINGFGPLGLAQITGECGDLNNYSNPAKVWKRMGLAVIDGKAQRRVKGAGALEQGYSPIRRSISWNIGTSMIKKQNPYRDLYLARKVTEQAKVPDGTKMLWHKRAQRYMEKRVLRDLWRAWTAQA